MVGVVRRPHVVSLLVGRRRFVVALASRGPQSSEGRRRDDSFGRLAMRRGGARGGREPRDMESDSSEQESPDSGNESSGDDVDFAMEVEAQRDRQPDPDDYPFEVLSTDQIVQYMDNSIYEVNSVVKVHPRPDLYICIIMSMKVCVVCIYICMANGCRPCFLFCFIRAGYVIFFWLSLFIFVVDVRGFFVRIRRGCRSSAAVAIFNVVQAVNASPRNVVVLSCLDEIYMWHSRCKNFFRPKPHP